MRLRCNHLQHIPIILIGNIWIFPIRLLPNAQSLTPLIFICLMKGKDRILSSYLFMVVHSWVVIKQIGNCNQCLEGLKRGYAVIAVNYRLSWEATFPALVQDAKAAVRWVRGNAKWYSLDPDRIAAWGGSAGGYLSTMLGVSEGIPELEDLYLGNPDQPCGVQAVVDWFGPTNFLKMDEQLTASDLSPLPGTEHNNEDSPESLLLGGKITDFPERVKAANPETYIRKNAAPFLIQHGIADFTVPFQQSIGLAENLKRVCGEERVVLELFEGFEHGDHRLGSPVNVKRVLDFIDKHLKNV